MAPAFSGGRLSPRVGGRTPEGGTRYHADALLLDRRRLSERVGHPRKASATPREDLCAVARRSSIHSWRTTTSPARRHWFAVAHRGSGWPRRANSPPAGPRLPLFRGPNRRPSTA